MSISDWLTSNTKQLREVGIESARLDLIIILQHSLKKDKNWILTNQDENLSDSAVKKLNEIVKRRAKREPLAYILGFKEFYGFDFQVSTDVLIPRPETEELVTYINKNAPPNGTLLDVGTGSGAIAVTSKLLRPDLTVHGIDKSKEALQHASENAKKLNALVEFNESNLFNNVEEVYDVVAANLPYLRSLSGLEPELKFEPESALVAENDGLAIYEAFFDEVEEFTTDDGFIIVEHDPHQFDWLLSYTHRRANRVSDFVTVFL